MKKLASITLSALLTATMVCSSLTMASATDNGTDLVENATGSITLYKYDSTNVTYDKDTKTYNFVKGSQAESDYEELKTEYENDGDDSTTNETAKSKILEKYQVEDAKFTAYKVLDLDSSGYTVNTDFQGSGITADNLVKVKSGTETEDTYYSYGTYGTTTELEAQITKLQNWVDSQKMTGVTSTESNGVYTIGKTEINSSDTATLKPGVYLVEETGVPTLSSGDTNYVVSTQSFLVAVPQWNQETTYSTSTLEKETDSTTNTTTHWQYSITAYPKDESIEVSKTMKDHSDGKTDVTEDSYEIGDTIPYTVTATIPNYGMSADYPDTLTVTQNLALNYTKTVDGATTVDKSTGTKMFNNLALSFTDTLSKGLMLDASSLKITIKDASDTTVKELTTTDTNKNEEYVLVSENNNYQTTDKTQDTYLYTVLAQNADSLEDSGASYVDKNDSSKEITDYSKEGTVKYTTKYARTVSGSSVNTNYSYYVTTNTTSGETTMTVYVPWIILDTYQGYKIELTYEASLTNEAVQGTAESNGITYKFQNNPQTVTSDAYDPKGSTSDETKVYTYGMELTKQFDGGELNDSNKSATAVKFQLKSKDGKTTYSFVANDDNNDSVDNDGSYTLYNADADTDTTDNEVTVYNKKTDNTTTKTTEDISPNSDGKLTIKGLAAGTYQLVETATVDGYSILTAPIYIVVTEGEDKDGNINGTVSAEIKESTGDSAATIQILKTQADSVEAGTTATDAQKATFTITVNNSKNQFNLPLTGGLGLWIFTIAGGVIMAVAIIVISVGRSKKKAAK